MACNKCDYERLKRNAESRGLHVVLRPAPRTEPKYPHGVAMFELKPGKVIGTWLRWFPTRPLQCMCHLQEPLINRSGLGWENG